MSHPVRIRLAPLALAVVLVLGGCGSSGGFYADPGEIAQRFIPTERQVDHHPDSLRALTVEEKENTYKIALENGYQSLLRSWSSSFQSMGAGRTMQSPTYATLRSREIALASLQAETGVGSLTKDRASELIAGKEEEYRRTLQIEVYWFGDSQRTAIAGPGTRVRLLVDGQEYRPDSQDYGPIREALLTGASGTALYRLNVFNFSRIVDDQDILDGVNRIELAVRRSSLDRRFAWSWNE
jgi:hypothetical protein